MKAANCEPGHTVTLMVSETDALLLLEAIRELHERYSMRMRYHTIMPRAMTKPDTSFIHRVIVDSLHDEHPGKFTHIIGDPLVGQTGGSYPSLPIEPFIESMVAEQSKQAGKEKDVI